MRKQFAAPTMWTVTVVCALWCVAPAWSAESSPRTQRSEDTTGAVRGARDAVVAEAVKGKLTPKVIDLYYRYAEQCARAAAHGEKVTDEFWKWFDANAAIRKGILAGMDCADAGRVVGCLAELRGEFKGDVDRYVQLAIAFALAYGRAGDGSIRQWDWVAKGRPSPGMIESFGYYMAHKGEMLLPLEAASWPLLVHVADIDAPIAERKWVLSKYRGRSLESLRRLHSDPRYIKEGGGSARKMGKKEGAPFALPRILQDGGVCSQKAYYAAAVLKSLGVPAFRLVGDAHAWEGWVLRGVRNQYTTLYGAALGRQMGKMKCPLKRMTVRQHEVEMRVAAVSKSYLGYIDARVAAAAYAMVPKDRRGQAAGLLRAALSRNGYCTEVWRHLARACADGLLSDAEAGKLYPTALRILADHPQMTCEIFTTLISAKLQATKNVDERALAETIRAVEHEAGRYEGLKRDDLGAKLRNLLGAHVAAVKGPAAVCKLYHSWLGSGDSHKKIWSKGLIQGLTKLTRAKKALPVRAKFLADELARLPARNPPGKRAKKKNPDARGKPNVRYIQFANAYAKTLRKLGKTDEAARIEAVVAQLTGKKK